VLKTGLVFFVSSCLDFFTVLSLKRGALMIKRNRSILKLPVMFMLVFSIIMLFGVSINSLAQIGTWVRKADMPTPRDGLGTAIVDGKIYAFGGYTGPPMATVEVYDLATDKWEKRADMPIPRYQIGVEQVNGKIYVIGGWNVKFPPDGITYSRVDEYDSKTDTWIKKADMLVPHTEFCTATVNGKIYVISGGYFDYDNNGAWYNTSSVEEYDPYKDKWTEKADIPNPIDWGSASVVNGKIYVVGGDLTNALVQEYDPIKDLWTRKADMPTPRFSLATVEVGGKIYAIGGTIVGPGDRGMATVEIYDPIADTWGKGTDLPETRWCFSASVINGKIYAIGGYNGSLLNRVDVLDTGLGMQVKAISLQEVYVTGGDLLTIFGADFLPGLQINIGDKPLLDQKVTDTLITGIIPPNTEGEKDIILSVPEFNYTSVIGKIFYKPVSSIIVTKITPNNGKQAGGDVVSIIGSGFITGATVTVGGNPGTNVGVTPTLITFKIPQGTEGTKDIVVTNPDGQRGILRNGYTYNPFPIIDEILPMYGGPLAGGTEVTVRGENFIQGVIVFIGSDRIPKLDLFSTTELQFKTPVGTEGMKPIRVVNPDGQEVVFAEGFKYNYPPSIRSIEPNAGALEGGTGVTITGENFDVRSVYVGEISAGILFSDSITITIVTPPSSVGVKDIVVENYDGQTDTLEKAFTYNPAPTITGIAPNNGKLDGYKIVTIQGNGFLPNAKVGIGVFGQDNIMTVIPLGYWEYISPTVMKAKMPPSDTAKTINIVVINPDDQKAVLRDGYKYNSIPTITNIQPNNGPSSGGTKLLITGSGFLTGAKVIVGFSESLSVIVKDDSTIEAITPSGKTGMSNVIVMNPDTQIASVNEGFLYIGKFAYNYPNPFKASQGTTFRYLTNEKVESIEVRVFNTGGVPIDAVVGNGSNEVKWQNSSLRRGIYVYIMEVMLEGNRKDHYKGVLEVTK
jgi:N-acetylneuraminic acid mutarotase